MKTKQMFDDMKYFTIICTFLIVRNNVGILVSLLKRVKVFGNQIDLNKKHWTCNLKFIKKQWKLFVMINNLMFSD